MFTNTQFRDCLLVLKWCLSSILRPRFSFHVIILEFIKCFYGPGSSVSKATDYGLDGHGIISRWGEIFPPVQTGPGAHPASCTMGTGSLPGVALTTHPLLVPWSWKSRAIPLPTLLSTTGSVTGTLYFYLLL